MGGLISSTFLTLLVLPWIDARVEDTVGWAKRVRGLSGPAAAVTAPTRAEA